MKATVTFDDGTELEGDIIEVIKDAVGAFKRSGHETGQIIVVVGNGLSNFIDEINEIDGVTAKTSHSNYTRDKGPKHKEPFWTNRGRKS